MTRNERWSGGWVGGNGEKVTSLIIRIVDASICAQTYLWRAETLVERPPKEEAIVLNSTCLMTALASRSDGSLWTM